MLAQPVAIHRLAIRWATFMTAAVTAVTAVTAVAVRAQVAAEHTAAVERLRRDVQFLASPECEGRGIDTRGIDKAAASIAEEFRKAGLRPAMPDGSYFQPFTVTAAAKLAEPPRAVLRPPQGKTIELEAGVEFTAMGFSASGTVNAPLAFVGYGITAPELKYDDYANTDVAGKVVIMIRRTPRANERGERRFDGNVANPEESTHAAFVTKIENARRHKAAAVIIVNDAGSAGERDPLPQFANHAVGIPPAPFPVLFMKRSVLDDILHSHNLRLRDIEQAIDADLRPQSRPLPGWTIGLNVRVERTEYQCKNVVGVLDGSGPLAQETLIIGAHYDHIGYGNFGSLGGPKARGQIHFGADDNASGTAALLELARRMAAAPRRDGRRVVFIAFSAEERGLFGSLHYCKQPLFPLETTAAMLNMDMVGRAKQVHTNWFGWEKKERLLVYGVGTGSGLEQLVHKANGNPGLALRTLPGGTGPSDHDSFYRKRVPVLFFYTGTHGDYHRPSDTADKINYDGMAQIVDYVYRIADELRTQPERPRYQVVRDAWRDPTDPRATPSPRGQIPRLGVRPGNYESEDGGLLVDGVTPGGPADRAGIKEGDVIVAIAGHPVKNIGTYMAAMSQQKAGTTIEVVILRKGERLTLKVTPE